MGPTGRISLGSELVSTEESVNESVVAFVAEVELSRSSEAAIRAIGRIDAHLREVETLSVHDKIYLLSAKARILTVLSGYRRTDTLAEADRAYRDALALSPDNVITLTSLAQMNHFQAKKLDVALQWAETATAVAEKQLLFVRLAYGVLCRIAIALERHDLIERSIRRLIEYIPPSNPDADIGLEYDFVSRIPAGALPPGLLEAYQEKLGRRPSSPKSDKIT